MGIVRLTTHNKRQWFELPLYTQSHSLSLISFVLELNPKPRPRGAFCYQINV
jgi:hypothetical protein